MSIIAVDIDDTLYDFNTAIRDEFFKMAMEYDDRSILKGAYTPHVEWRSLSDSLESEIVYEAIQRVHKDESILSQKPFNHACDTLWALSDNGHEILYISSRRDECYEATVEWLTEHYFPNQDNLICVSGPKAPHITSVQYLIDDRPQTVVDFVTDYTWKRSRNTLVKENQRMAFGLWFPYNQALTDVKNVYLAPSWLGIEYYLKRKGLLL